MEFEGVLAFEFGILDGWHSQQHKLIKLIVARMLSICLGKRISELLIVFHHLKHHFKINTCCPTRSYPRKFVFNECLSFYKVLSFLKPGMNQAPELEIDAPDTLFATGIVYFTFDRRLFSDDEVVLAEGDTRLGRPLL